MLSSSQWQVRALKWTRLELLLGPPKAMRLLHTSSRACRVLTFSY